jgi:hypothetical protein
MSLGSPRPKTRMKIQTRLRGFVWIGGLIFALAFPAGAARILFLDAASPGPDPVNQWNDLSASGYHFANDPTNSTTHNPTNLSYEFEFFDRMTGTGDESTFDFDTGWGEPPNEVPFSIVAYLQHDWDGPGTYTIVTKTDEPGDGQFFGWHLGGSGIGPNVFDFSMQPGDNFSRLYTRTADGIGGSPMLLVLTHTGSGNTSDIIFYVNGSPAGLIFEEDFLFGSTTNNFPLVLGAAEVFSANNTGWQGSLFFLEIHDTVLTPVEIAQRWNGGAPLRVGQANPVVDSTVATVSGLIELSLGSLSGVEIQVQQTDDLVTPVWTLIATLSGNGDVLRAYDTDPQFAAKKYRFVIPGL